MDISSIGYQHFNQPRNPFSASVQESNSGLDFGEMIKRMQNTANTDETGTVTGNRFSRNAPIDKSSKLYEACLELETFLMKNLIKGMRNTVQKTNLIDTGFAGEVYEDMLYDEYAKIYTKNANFGFAEMAYRELTGTR